MFDTSLTERVEENLKDLVRGVKGVRHIRGCSNDELQCYRIIFGYQRRDPLKNYLLIYDPLCNEVRLCADGGIGNLPTNVRQQLLGKLGYGRCDGEPWIYTWREITLDELLKTEM